MTVVHIGYGGPLFPRRCPPVTILDAIILGLVEGVTEYLPVSSTGHLILAANLLGLGESAAEKEAIDAFNIVIQGGAILAVLGVFWPRVRQMLAGLRGRDREGLRLAINIIIAFLPAAIVGPFLGDWIWRTLFFPAPVIAALAVGGVLMILMGPWQRMLLRERGNDDHASAGNVVAIEDLTWRKALFIGLLQCVAIWPGTSRSMVTIVGGMLVGMRPRHAAEFSFLLALPTLSGACVYKGLQNFMGDGPHMFEVLGATNLVVGIVVATIAAGLAVKWLVSYLQRHGVAAFGWYRIALAGVLVALVALGHLDISPTESPATTDAAISEHDNGAH